MPPLDIILPLTTVSVRMRNQTVSYIMDMTYQKCACLFISSGMLHSILAAQLKEVLHIVNRLKQAGRGMNQFQDSEQTQDST